MFAARHRPALLVAASLALHAAVLLPLALSGPYMPSAPRPSVVRAIPLDLTPWTQARVDHTRPRSTSPRPGPSQRPADDDARIAAAESPLPAAPTPSATGAPFASGEASPGGGLRLGPPLLVCPPAPGDRIGRRRCALGREPEPETYADLAPSRAAESDQAREEGFDRQARANEAWREYTRGEGAYPGLRSLLRDR